jgi:predicted DNA binding CopG/RHH family protein
MKTVQYFTDEYLESAKKATPTQIVTFLEQYRSLHDLASLPMPRERSKLISLRLPIRLLRKLKKLSAQKGVPYQTLLKKILETGLDAID